MKYLEYSEAEGRMPKPRAIENSVCVCVYVSIQEEIQFLCVLYIVGFYHCCVEHTLHIFG